MSLILVTAPAAEPVTLSEAKDHLRVTEADEDSLITSLITAARDIAESFTNRAFVTQTWSWKLDTFRPCLEVPKAPLVSVSSIQYVDGAGATQTLAASGYQVADAASHTVPGRIVPAYGQAWPATRGMPNDITVQYVAGYGGASAVPPQIRWAILLILGELYARRESAIAGTIITKVPYSAEALLMPFVVHAF
jgi:uncharacterized phiE125 gp8 family phage protein